ncbi:integrase [Gossypium australe]|uniref:Integrase n=1 Tax=Gossypium australe TaxID=47621 RepID=A0A5B6VLR8_9ROSI|nr:integrase [Gossypium australe]
MSQKELNLRQRRWLELLKDYGLIINYQLADALSQKSLSNLKATNICESHKNDLELVAKREQVGKLRDTKFQIGANASLTLKLNKRFFGKLIATFTRFTFETNVLVAWYET